jgi:hypothetical protein
MRAINLDGAVMYVSSTDNRGIVDAETRLYFTQKESRVFARYNGGSVRRGCLVGTLYGSELVFRYTQVEDSGQIHGGRSICEVQRSEQAGLRVIEHFMWNTRSGSGTNIFDQIR